MWCGKCYCSNEGDPKFFVASGEVHQVDEEDEDRLMSGWNVRSTDCNRFRTARNGDDLLVSFECDSCIFGKLYKREPSSSSTQDCLALACIRRINLDAFWSRARSTVEANASKVREGLKNSRKIGLDGPYLDPGPLPSHDHCGYEVAIQMVLSSLDAGRYADSHKQWDTIRKLRSCYSNQVRAARDANCIALVLADTKGVAYQRLAVDVCGSLWFQRFMLGCKRRMGQDWRPNQALGIKLLHRVLNLAENRARSSGSQFEERDKWIMAGGYFCICFVLSLRSPEGLMTDLEGLIKYFDDKADNVVIPLLGRFKGEHHAKQHLLPCQNITGSGLNVKLWVKRIIGVHRASNRINGPAFVNTQGYQSSTSELNELFLELLVEAYDIDPSLFNIDVESSADLVDKYNVFRSFRRGSESRAVAMKVSEADRYVVNRWKRKEAAGANKVNHAIDQHYVDIAMVKDSFLRYTAAM